MKPGKKPTGRWKPCVRCGTSFWCEKCRDVGGAYLERIYCGVKCYYAAIRDHNPDDLLWQKVNKNGPNGCWVYSGACDRRGYGRPATGHKRYYAHRRSWEIHNGPIQKGLLVLHKCDNPPCCNPEHLFLGNDADNALDAARKGRTLRGEKSYTAKLTEAQVREIRANPPAKWKKGKWIGAGEEMAEYAARYGVGSAAIGNVLARRTWRHL